MGSSSFLMNIIQVLQTEETVATDTLNLSAKSFVKSPSLSLNYGGPEGTSLPNKNVTISLKLCHPSLKNIVVFCVNLVP